MVYADEGNNYIFDGQSWGTDITTRTGSIAFPLDFGTGPVSGRTFTLDTHGQIQFTSSGVPTGDFIAPLLAPTPYAPDSGITYASGLLDPSVVNGTTATSFNIANGLQAERFYWNFVCPTGQPTCGGAQFQAVLVDLDPEHFVLLFNYNDFNPTITGGTAGYKLGANLGSFAGPYSDVGPDYCFANGVASRFTSIAACTNAVTTTVPEPDVGSLVLLGGLGLMLSLITRRRTSSPRLAA